MSTKSPETKLRTKLRLHHCSHGSHGSLEERVLELRRATFDELDQLLKPAHTPAQFKRQCDRLVKALKGIRIVSSGHAEERGGGTGVWDFLLKSQKRDEPLSTYLAEIGQIPRTQREDELRLGRRLEFLAERVHAACREARLDPADVMQSQDVQDVQGGALECEEVRQTCAEYQAARAEFIERNLHLVVSAAVAYRTYAVPLLDLIQEGNAGLIRAVEKFDWRKNVRLQTYAALWIRQAIERSIASSKGIVRLPNYIQQKMRRLKREGQLPVNDRETSVHDLSKAFDLSHKVAGRLLETHRSTASLDQEFGDDGDSPAALLAARDDERNGFQTWELPLLKSRIGEALSLLSEQERKILTCRYGFGSDSSMTLEEIGREMKVSRERIRQLQLRAIRKLRTPSIREKLAQFV
jgi:RNA polymerase primary sigma factor